MKKVIAITGWKGFLGTRFIQTAGRGTDVEIRALTRSSVPDGIDPTQNLISVCGSVGDPSCLNDLLQPGCDVVHLAYDSAASLEENIADTTVFADACARREVRRVIHCSTAMVVGRTSATVIDEATECHPVTIYEQSKLAIENLFLAKARGNFELVVLRPTAVLGPGGLNLLKMANELTRGSRFANGLRSFANGRRRLNLVAVENVVAAMDYLLQANDVSQETFIISDDEDPLNNYHDVQRRLLHQLAVPDHSIHAELWPKLLALLLRLRGRSLTNPQAVFSCQKLKSAGFKKPVSLASAVDAFAAWYKGNHRPLARLH